MSETRRLVGIYSAGIAICPRWDTGGFSVVILDKHHFEGGVVELHERHEFTDEELLRADPTLHAFAKMASTFLHQGLGRNEVELRQLAKIRVTPSQTE